jgi:hypothetical protein
VFEGVFWDTIFCWRKDLKRKVEREKKTTKANYKSVQFQFFFFNKLNIIFNERQNEKGE